MKRKRSLFAAFVIIFTSSFFFVILPNTTLYDFQKTRLKPVSSIYSTKYDSSISSEPEEKFRFSPATLPTTKTTTLSNRLETKKEKILNKMRMEVESELEELQSYMASVGKSTKGNLLDNPKHNLILSSWRSGSSFLGDLISSYPGSYYFFEPLLQFGPVQVTHDLGPEAVRIVEQLLLCNYTKMDKYIEKHMQNMFLERNKPLKKHCGTKNLQTCSDEDFQAEACGMFPYRTMKLVRMRLRFSETIVTNPKLNAKVVYLVRDPRGVMNSRRKHSWCKVSEDCGNHKNLCDQMLCDYNEAKYLKKLYPDKYFILRYEDLSLNVTQGLQTLQDFFGLEHHPRMNLFLKSHTSQAIDKNEFSTVRNPEDVVFKWKKFYKDKPTDLAQLQEDCHDALQAWGYKPFNWQTDNWDSFLPIEPTKYPMEML